MSRQFSELEVTPGERPAADKYNALVRAALRNHAGRGTHVDSTGVYQRPDVRREGKVSLGHALGVQDNHLMVSFGGADPVPVAKFPEVQRAEYDGMTVTDPVGGHVWTFEYTGPQTRTVTRDGDETQNQVIVPRYVPAAGDWPGSTIIAIRARLSVPDSNDTVVCNWIEVGNRAFARAAT